MALTDDQKLDLIIRAYAEGYKGDFQALFDMADKQAGPPPIIAHESPKDPPPQIDYQKENEPLAAQPFTDARAKKLIKKYNKQKIKWQI